MLGLSLKKPNTLGALSHQWRSRSIRPIREATKEVYGRDKGNRRIARPGSRSASPGQEAATWPRQWRFPALVCPTAANTMQPVATLPNGALSNLWP